MTTGTRFPWLASLPAALLLALVLVGLLPAPLRAAPEAKDTSGNQTSTSIQVTK